MCRSTAPDERSPAAPRPPVQRHRRGNVVTLTLSQHLIVLGLLALDALVRGVRFQRLVPMPLARAVSVNLAGDAAASLTPVGIGADPVRYAAHQRAGSATSALLAAFGTELGVGLATMVLLAAALALVFSAAAAEWGRRLAVLFTPAWALRMAVLVILPAALSLAVLVRFRRRLPPRILHPVRAGFELMRRRPPGEIALVVALTMVSVAARTAILPVLAARVPGASSGLLVVGSFLLLFGQTSLPTPAGAGGVELGFVAGFSGLLRGRDVAGLLAVYRSYTLLLGLAVGAVLLLWRPRERRRGSPIRSPG